MKPEIQARLDAANEFIRVIANIGRRRFFSHTCKVTGETKIARIERDGGGACWYHNEWTGRRIYISRLDGEWDGFHHGGTLRSIIECLVKFINTGWKLPAGIGSVHWGYSEADVEQLRAEALRLGLTEHEREMAE